MNIMNVSKSIYKALKQGKHCNVYEEVPLKDVSEGLLLKARVSASVEAKLMGFARLGDWTFRSIGFYTALLVCTLFSWIFVHNGNGMIWLFALFLGLLYTVMVCGYMHIMSGLFCNPDDITVYAVYKVVNYEGAYSVVQSSMVCTKACLTTFIKTKGLCEYYKDFLPAVRTVDKLLTLDLLDETDDNIYIVFYNKGYDLGTMEHLFIRETPAISETLLTPQV